MTTPNPADRPFLLGLSVSYPAPGIIERIGPDWDWLWLDGQHGQLADYGTMLAMVRACHGIGRPAFVRVPGHEPSWIGLALDMAAAAVIVPQIDTVEQALGAVRAAKFPPLGNRSFGGRRPIDLQGRSYVGAANTATQLICQIESPEALRNAGDIAAIPGVDGLFLGPDDLSLRSGGLDRLGEAIVEISTACKRNGKLSICVGTSAETIAHCQASGVTHLVGGSDVGFLAGGSRTASAQLREAEVY